MTRLYVIVGVLVLGTLVGLAYRARSGRLRAARRRDRSEPLPEFADGQLVTLVQFSTRVCAPCVATRRVLTDVADELPGVRLVEVHAEERLDLTRRLHVRRAPTVFVIGPDGYVASRATGVPRREDVVAAVTAVAVS